MVLSEAGWTEGGSKRFIGHEGGMRGHIRYEITHENLLSLLGEFLDSPKRVLDMGGGAGLDARWLAGMKVPHDVKLMDPDPAMLAEATKHNDGRVEVIQGDTEAALALFGEAAFDLVLSHGVVMYLPEPGAELARLARLTRPGGFISLLNAGRQGKLDRYTQTADQAQLESIAATGHYDNNVGQRARAFSSEEFETMLQKARLETIDWFGVRVEHDDDDRPVDSVSAFHRNRVISEELRLSRDAQAREHGQMLHFVVRKP